MTAGWPRESDATLAVDAAAQKAREIEVERLQELLPPGARFPTWEELDKVAQNSYREAVLPIVWAALSILPDPRRQAWMEGYICADNGGDEDTNPY